MFSKHVIKDISAYCHGELSAEESRLFAEHVMACAKCRREFDDIKRAIKLAEQLPRYGEAPDWLWQRIEARLDEHKTSETGSKSSWQLRLAAVATVVVIVGLMGVGWFLDRGPYGLNKGSWQVQSLAGTPRIGSEHFAKEGQLGIGQWLETDGSSRAQIAVSTIGTVDIDENTRVRLVETEPTEHRLELARGKMSARIWAPPRLFFVDTPSAVAADLGCAYTLEVDDHGAGLLRVTSGWVALQLKDRESIVPAEAACETRPGVGPGTPYFEDASPAFRAALSKIDFEHDAGARSSALDSLLSQARSKDTLTLWHLLARVNGTDRERVYEVMASLSLPPAGVTREGVLQLNGEMLDRWRAALETTWSRGDPLLKKKFLKKLFE